jgi:AcrR family transcriptional regulator
MPHDPSGSADGLGSLAKRGYHHGRLREALLDAARLLLAERGVAGFSLADAAKLAGVSAAAPYRHFRDRDALLGEVAREGFALFGQRLGESMASAADPRQGFQAMGRAYLAFAREQPGLYAAMFSWAPSPAADGDPWCEAGRRAFELLIDGIGRVLGRSGSPAAASSLAAQVWALAHGIASLTAGNQFPPDCDPEALLAEGFERLLGLWDARAGQHASASS